MALSIVLGFLTIKFVARVSKSNISLSIVSEMLPVVTIFGLLMARIYYVFLDFDYFVMNPDEIFALWHGGLSIHGAILGGFISGSIYLKMKNQKILPYADVFSYGLLVGQAVGRWGNFFNSEAFGLPTDLPWKLYVPFSHRPFEFQQFQFFHPTFLYESIWNVLCFLILFFVLRKRVQKVEGATFCIYLILYSTGRIFIENLRIDSVLNIFNVPVAIIVSCVLIVISFITLIILIYKNGDKNAKQTCTYKRFRQN